METFRTWALTVALSALAGGIVRLLSPKGSVEKALRTVVAVFLLCAFLSPLFNRKSAELDWALPELEQAPTLSGYEREVAGQIQSAVEAELAGRMERVLAEQGVEGQISLRTDILSDGSIEIVTAKVFTQADNTERLAALLKAETGLDVEITEG